MLTRNPSLPNKNMCARNKVAHVELLRGGAMLVLRFAVAETYGNLERSLQKRFSILRKRWARPRTYFVTVTFGKSLFITQYRMRYAIYLPPIAKDLTIDLSILVYGNRQNAMKFARANNCDLLRALKHLMETLVYTKGSIFETIAVIVLPEL